MKLFETLTPNEVAKSLKLHPFTPPLRAGAGFTVTRLAREGLSAVPAAARHQAGVPGTAQAGKPPPVPSERQRVEGGFSADPPRQVVTAGRGGGSANLCGGKVGGSWRFRKDEFERWASTKSTKKTGRSKRVVAG